MNPKFSQIIKAYASLGLQRVLECEKQWERKTGIAMPNFNASAQVSSEWVEKHGSTYLGFLADCAVPTSPKSEVKPVKLAISCLFQKKDPLAQVLERVEAVASDVQKIVKSNMISKSEDLSLPPEMRDPPPVTTETIEEILSLEPQAEALQQTMDHELPLTAESSLLKIDGGFILYNSAEDLTVPIKDEEIKKILEDDSDLDSEDVEVEGVEGKASLRSYNGIPLWIKGLADDYMWSESSIKARIKEFLVS